MIYLQIYTVKITLGDNWKDKSNTVLVKVFIQLDI